MAATLTDKGELTTEYFSFPIEKVESTADGDLMVYGKASDGTIDSDQQIVDPAWMSRAVQEWLSTGPNVRVQHNAQRDPAGVGLEASTDGSGCTWVKSLVVEPVAKRLVSKGALRAYSVGISRPTISRDMVAKGGRITDGTLVEISLVDRPANKSCGFQLVKSADDGAMEWVGKVFGDDEAIQKALSGDVMEKSGHGGHESFDIPVANDIRLDFTPNDLMKILQNKIIDNHYDELALKAIFEAEAEVYKRDVSTAERRSLASAGHALSDGSYPIANAGDLGNAAHLARTGHGNAEGAKRLIARRAKELGVANPLDSESSEKGEGVADATQEIVKDAGLETEVTETAVKEAEPAVTKDPADGDGDGPKAKKPKKGKNGKPLPPWLQGKADATATDDDGDGDDDEDAESCKQDHAHTEKCTPSGTPKSTSGAKDAHDMDPIPHPDAYMETPMPAGRKAEDSAMLRFKMLGIDPDLGRLHDLTCPAFSPEMAAAYHPYSSLKGLINEPYWQRIALEAAAGKSIQEAMQVQKVWQAAAVLKGADEASLNDYRLEMHKAFRDANPGPTSYPTPGGISPSSFNRPLITDGHGASSPGHEGPNSSPQVASSSPNASHFDRPPLSSGHQSPSPSFMKADFEYPSEQGVPTRLNYAVMDKERARNALDTMHEHLSRQFPTACPMIAQDPNAQPESRSVPVPVTKSDEEPQVIKAPVESDEDLLRKELEAEVLKGRGKQMKKLGKKVMQGKMTFDQARAKMGNWAAMKEAEPPAVEKTIQASLEKVAAENPGTITVLPAAARNELTPEIMKSMMTEALEPMITKIKAQEELLTKQQGVLDAIADQPDPSTASFSGIALKTARPAAVKSQAEYAEHAQAMIRRNLEATYNSHSNPSVREAAGEALNKLRAADGAI